MSTVSGNSTQPIMFKRTELKASSAATGVVWLSSDSPSDSNYLIEGGLRFKRFGDIVRDMETGDIYFYRKLTKQQKREMGV